MRIDGLLTVLASYHPLSTAFREALEKELIPFSPPKNHILLDVPNISTHAYFLVDGFAISYSFFEGRKITQAFWKPGEIIISFESFFEQTPTQESIQLLQKSDVLCISFNSVMNLLERFPEAQHICRAVILRHYVQCRGRIHDLQQSRAHQRFEKLVHDYPDLELIVSQDAIASYLGITAQSLARMKRKAN